MTQATIELTAQELDDLRAFTQQENVNAAARTAMSEYLRYARRQQLKQLSGNVQMDDNWRELEALELQENHGRSSDGVR